MDPETFRVTTVVLMLQRGIANRAIE